MLDGYNLYHKSVVFFFWALAALALLRAVLVISGGAYELEKTSVISADAETLWLWVSDNKNRARWVAGVTDLTRLKGNLHQAGSTRMVFWRQRGKRWNAVEATVEAVPGRRFVSHQQADKDERNFAVELMPLGPCTTRVQLTEIIRPAAYADRYWSFFYWGEQAERLKVSLQALEKWMKREFVCPTGMMGKKGATATATPAHG